ncbi:MAG: restriction endonuclease subunit S [Labrenzia sp.]
MRLKTNRKLRDFCLAMAGGATPKAEEKELYYSDDPETGIPFIRVQNLNTNGDLETNDVKLINEATHNGMLARSHVHEDDLLVKITGVGRMAVSSVPPKGFEGNINQHIARAKTRNRMESRVLAAFLNTDIGEALATRRATGGTRPALDYPALRSIPIIYNEAILSVLDSANTRRKISLYKADALLASIDDYLLSELGIVLPPEPESTIANRMFRVSMRDVQQRHDPNFFGRKYVHLTEAITARPFKLLRDICSFSSEAWDQKTGYDGTFPYLEISAIDLKTGDVTEISDTPIEEAPSRARMVALPHDILISTTRPSRGAITLVPQAQPPFIASTGFAVIRAVDTSLIDREYLYHVLRSKLGLTQMEQRSSGGNYPAITPSELKRIEIPLPDLSTQTRIVAEIQKRKSAALSMRQEANAELDKAKAEIEAILLGDAA